MMAGLVRDVHDPRRLGEGTRDRRDDESNGQQCASHVLLVPAAGTAAYGRPATNDG